jgi:hypothetical protein
MGSVKILDPIFCFRKNSNGFLCIPQEKPLSFFSSASSLRFPKCLFYTLLYIKRCSLFWIYFMISFVKIESIK